MLRSPSLRHPARSESFNPHPLRRADATSESVMLCGGPMAFNPHPLRRADATFFRHLTPPPRRTFNPHPLRRADATCGYPQVPTNHRLSILIRSEERMLPSCQNRPQPIGKGFQSSSAPKSGCYTMTLQLMDALRGFQSSSAPKSGCYGQEPVDGHSQLDLSILIRSEERMLRHGGRIFVTEGELSILIRSEERMLQPQIPTCTRASLSFNPHPLRRADATATRCL